MKERILQTLTDLRDYALGKGYDVALFYHEEDSYLMRFANSAISLNTNEHLIRLDITAYDGRKRASYELITDLDKLDEMKRGIDIAAEMVKHAQPLNYQPDRARHSPNPLPTKAAMTRRWQGSATRSAWLISTRPRRAGDGRHQALGHLLQRLEHHRPDQHPLGAHASISSTSDAQVTVVLSTCTIEVGGALPSSPPRRKATWTQQPCDRNWPSCLTAIRTTRLCSFPSGSYDIVFGSAATGDLLSIMNWIGFNGGSMKRGFSFLSEDQVGKKVFSDKFTLVDDPNRLETFPFKRDLTGIIRKPFPIFENGVFQGLYLVPG